jgi:hypothetical protein
MIDRFVEIEAKGQLAAAIANSLIGRDDFQTGMRVFNHFSSHPLVTNEGTVEQLLVPELISELTRGKYEATLYTKFLFSFNEIDYLERLREIYGDKAETLAQIVKEGREKKQINSAYFHNYHSPAIFLVNQGDRSLCMVDGRDRFDLSNGGFLYHGRDAIIINPSKDFIMTIINVKPVLFSRNGRTN